MNKIIILFVSILLLSIYVLLDKQVIPGNQINKTELNDRLRKKPDPAAECDIRTPKQEAPEEYAKWEQFRRTPVDRLYPEYGPNQKLAELNKSKANKRTQFRNETLEFIERGPRNVAGRTRALLVIPDDENQATWIAASATGGIWKTTDRGKSWEEKTADLPNLGTNTLAMSKADPNIIYAGTGEHFTRDIDGSGLFKSEDQGESWTQIVAPGDYPAFRNISRIAVHPENPDTVIVTCRNSVWGDGLEAAIYKSVNGGESWEVKRFSTEERYDDIAVNSKNFNTLYIAIQGKGVLKSTDQGETWEDASQGLNITGRIEIAASPIDTSYIWGSAQGGQSGNGSDLYLSKNGGENWQLIVSETESNIDFLGGQGWFDNVIEAHPFNNNTVYAGGVNLFKFNISNSEIEARDYEILDSGAFEFLEFINGTRIGGGILTGDLPADEVVSIELRFDHGGQIAHRFTVDGRGAGVPDNEYMYADLVDIPFQAWDVTNNKQLMVSFRDQGNDGEWTLKERALNATDTQNDSREYIFVHEVPYADSADLNIAINGGQTYRQLFFMWPVLRNGTSYIPSDTSNSSAFSILSELVLRLAYEPTVISDAYSDFDGNNDLTNEEFANNLGIHPDQHSLQHIVVHESNRWFRLLLTNDGGVYISNTSKDPGSSDNSFSYAGFGYNTTQFYGADKMPGEDRYIGGMQDNSTWFTSEENVSSENAFFDFAFGGDGFESIWNNRNPELMIGSIQFNSFQRSIDMGKNWESATNGITDIGPFVSRLANSKALPDRLFTVGSSGVWVSNDFGANWTSTPIGDMWSFNNGTDIEVSPANPNVIWTGGFLSQTQRLFVSTDGGQGFIPTNNYEDMNMGAVSGIGLHPGNTKTAYALFSFAKRPKVLRTTDMGQSWQDITGFSDSVNGASTRGFPDVAVNALLVFPNDTNRIWVGSEIGIIESLDGGESWGLFDSNLPAVNINEFKIQDDQVILATYGRGIWTVQIEGIQRNHIFPPILTSINVLPDGDKVIKAEIDNPFDSLQLFINDEPVGEVILEGIEIGKIDLQLEDITIESNPFTANLVGWYEGESYISLPIEASIFIPNDPTDRYFNDFTDSDLLNDFVGAGFSVRMEPGFDELAIHSDHNYSDAGEITYMLKTPIIVSEEQFFRYKDVAIVESGEPGAAFGSRDFYDYVVVEGSLDGIIWKPLADGYDATFDPSWSSVYNSSGSGNAGLFIEHEIDLKSTFGVDDVIFIRFRLFADPFVNGWGWAIDDVKVLKQGTTPVLDPAFESSKVFPNPADENINIYLPELQGNVVVHVYNLQGQLIGRDNGNTLQGNNISISTSEYKEGSYVLVIIKEGRPVLSEKIVIIH